MLNHALGREQAFIDAAERYGTKSSIIRLNYSIDLRYGVLVDIGQKVLSGIPVDVTTGFVNVIWQRDAVAHIIASLSLAQAPPQILNVTGPEVHRVRDIAIAFGKQFGREPVFYGEETDTAWLSNARESHRLFGTPETSTDQMIAMTADWLKKGGELLNKPTHFEARDGKY